MLYAAELEKHKAKWEERKQQMEAHKGEILTYLSQYTGKNVKDLEGYLNDDIHLPHLIGAAVISHVSKKDLSEVIKYKKEEHSREEFAAQFNIDKKEFMNEMTKVKTDIQSIIKK